MKIEKVNKRNVKKLSTKELYDLRERITQIWQKRYTTTRCQFQKSELIGFYEIVAKELSKRDPKYEPSQLDKIVFRKNILGFDIEINDEIVVKKDCISISPLYFQYPKDYPLKVHIDMQYTLPEPILKNAIIDYEPSPSSYIPLYDLVLKPIDRIEVRKNKEFYIKILGNMANEVKRYSFLIHTGDTNILIDPIDSRFKVEEKIDIVILTQPDVESYQYLPEYKDSKIYSVAGILDRLPDTFEKHPFLKPLKADGLEIVPIKTTPRGGNPSIGLRISTQNEKISILPKFSELGEFEKELIGGTIWIVGIGDYQDNGQSDEISFQSLTTLAEELKPKSIYILDSGDAIENHRSEIESFLKNWNGRILQSGEVLNSNAFQKAEKKWQLNKPKYRIFEIADLDQTPGFDNLTDYIIEAKFDGVRAQISKSGGEVEVFTDPEELKGSPLKNERLPFQVEELKKMPQDNFILDTEIIMLKDKSECLHRTAVNALLNGKYPPEEDSAHCLIEVFDILEYNGKDIKSYPLKERKEILSGFQDTEHIKFVSTANTLDKDSLSYMAEKEKISEALTKIMGYAHEDGAYPKYIAEGVMIKDPNKEYEYPQSSGMVKWKEKFEIDTLVCGKTEIIRDGKKNGNYNYDLCVGPITKDWADSILAVDKSRAIEYDGEWYIYLGKSDNTGIDCKVGDILRIEAEDVNKFETDNPKYPYYGTYVAVALTPVPEKDRPDEPYVLERLSELTPTRKKGEIEKKGGAFHSIGRLPIRKELAQVLPPHKIYVEAFAGGGEVIWEKDPSEVEVINDINPLIIKAHRIIKSLKEEDYKKLARYNWTKDKEYFNNLKKREPANNLDFIHKIMYLSTVGIKSTSGGFFDFNYRFQVNPEINDIQWEKRLRVAQERFKNVILENSDYQEIVKKYDSKDTFFLFDPPHPGVEMYYQKEPFDCERLGEVLKKIKGKFILIIRGSKEQLQPFESFHKVLFHWKQSWRFIGHNVRPYVYGYLYSNFKFELKKIKKSISEDVKISNEIYEQYAKPNEPLPAQFYIDQRGGDAFCQAHIRGLDPEKVEQYENGKLELAELLTGHSIHIDLRMDIGEERLIQWVITASDVEKYINILRGEYTETAAGVKQPTKGLAIVKPSAEEPEKKVKKSEAEPSISQEGAKTLASYEIPGSYIIPAGDVGASAYKSAYMELIWRGKVKTGVERKDYHEYFFYPDADMPEKNSELLNGVFIVKAFKRPRGEGSYWQFWKATEGMPADPILHKDSGYHYPVPAEKLERIGKEYYEYGKKEPVK